MKKPKLAQAFRSWNRFCPEYKHYFFTDAMCESFMKNVMGGDIYKAYCKLPMVVMKADLWRYCVIYMYGGIYADMDTVCLTHPRLFRSVSSSSLLVVSPEEGGDYLCQWVFAAPPRSPMLWEVIQESVQRILAIRVFLGENLVHYLTGPAVFSDGIEKYLRKCGLPTLSNREAYYRRYACLSCFYAKRFHLRMVKHLFSGSDDDGWKKERDRKLLR
jgi:mannosyltransferase OCH1-like enzyme